MKQMIAIAAIVGIFSLIGSLMAFAITFHEYARHKLERGKAFQAAMKTAAVAFVILGTLTMIAVASLFRNIQ